MIRGIVNPRHILQGRLVGADYSSWGQQMGQGGPIGVMNGMPPGIGNPAWGQNPLGLGFPNGLNYQNGPVLPQPRVFSLGLTSNGPIAAGTSKLITTSPQGVFKAQRLSVPSSIAPYFIISQIKVGAKLQSVDGSDTGVPAEIFSEVSQNNLMDFDTAQPGIVMSLVVTNVDSVARAFFGAFIGPAAVA